VLRLLIIYHSISETACSSSWVAGGGWGGTRPGAQAWEEQQQSFKNAF